MKNKLITVDDLLEVLVLLGIDNAIKVLIEYNQDKGTPLTPEEVMWWYHEIIEALAED